MRQSTEQSSDTTSRKNRQNDQRHDQRNGQRNSRPNPQDKGEGETKQSQLTWLIPLGLIAVVVLLYFLWPGFQGFVNEAYSVVTSGNQERLRSWVSGFGAWGPLLVYTLMVAQTLLAFIPSLAVTLVPVLAYGPLWGGLLAWSGLLLAAVVAYGVGRALGPVTVERFIGHSTERKIEGFVERYGVWGIVAARVSPALSTDAVSFVAGLVKMGFWRFLLATAVGTLPLVGLIAFLGQDVRQLGTGLVWVSLVSLVTFIAYVVWDRRQHRRQAKEGQTQEKGRS